MTDWKKVKLGEICLSISDGDHQAPPKVKEGIPFITISNIDSSNHIDFSDTLFVPAEYYNNIDDKRKAKKGDILYSVVGSFGKPVKINNNVSFAFQRHIAILRPDEKIVASDFLYYVMLSRDFYMQADSVALGAAQRTITLTALKNMLIELPSLDNQKKIAETLSRYDDLIENYQKQIKLLEEAAQRLYKEWFVDLHFPGYENVKVVDGVPEGWEKKIIADFGEVVTGKTPSKAKADFWGEEIPFVTIPDMHGNIFPSYSSYLSKAGAESQNKKYIPKDSLMVSCIATAGLVNITDNVCQTNQQINSLILSDKAYLYYLFFAFSDLKEYLNYLGSNGATMTNVNKGKFEKIEVIKPRKKIIEDYNRLAKPIFGKILNLQSQISLLTESRDRLLPKLMSGEIKL